jgi:hypothetical protein
LKVGDVIKTTMKNSFVLAASFALFGLIAPVRAATSTYQVTGPVLEVTDAKIVIQKDTEKWEISRSADTKVTGEIKVGSKITVQYTMAATAITAKPEKAAKPAVAPTKPAAPVKPAATPAKPAVAPEKPVKKAA